MGTDWSKLQVTYPVQSIYFLGLWGLVSATVSTVSTEETSASARARRRSAGDATIRTYLGLCGPLTHLPGHLERFECVLHLPPRGGIPCLKLGFVRMDKGARVLHARRR